MSTFVLVHGAWQSASTWDLVPPKLRAAGHVVVIPASGGLEQHAGACPLSPAITLQSHIENVVGVLTRENLQNAILVGHGYAGMIITGVAEKVPDRVRSLVYVDAFVPCDGQSALDLLPATVAAAFRQQANTGGGGWLLRAGEGQLDMWGLKPGAGRDFVRSRLSDFSLRCFEETIHLPTNAGAKVPRTFIACVAEGYPARPVFQRFADRAKLEEWHYHELPAGQDCHVEMPDAFVSKLLESESPVVAVAK